MKKLALIIALFGVGYLAQAQQGPAAKPVATPSKGGVATANTTHNVTTVNTTEKTESKSECTTSEKKSCDHKKSCCSGKKAEAKKN